MYTIISIYSSLLAFVYFYSEGIITKNFNFEYLLNHRVTSSLLHREVKLPAKASHASAETIHKARIQ